MTAHVAARAAVFDLDNTLIRGASMFHFGWYLARRRRIPMRHVARYALAELRYVTHREEPAGAAHSIAERGLAVVAGMSQDQMEQWVEDFLDVHLTPILDPHMRLQVLSFKQRGYLTFVATASPQELATAIARRLGMTGAIGTVAEVVDGRYTGRLVGGIAHGSDKAWRVRHELDSRCVDVQASWAFSDSVNDVPLLGMVGNPVAVDPDPELGAIARRMGWPMIVGDEDDDDPVRQFSARYP